jgi:hypothetical protein
MSAHASDLSEKWHKQVEGIWHGCPGVYDHDGQWQGYTQADRSIFIDQDGQHLIRVDTKVNCFGRLRARLETPTHLLRVKHVENKRVYEGPDFYGAGYPYGTLILGNDYCVPWSTDNRVTVQLLPGAQLQAYSNVAYEGNTLVCVISGLYRLSRDHETNADTQQLIARHREDEITRSKDVHILPRKTAGVFRGELETYTPDQKLVGMTTVNWDHMPVTQYRCVQDMKLSGAMTRSVRMERTRHENHHFFEDGLWGNGIGFGRAMFWRGNFKSETTRLVGRDFQLDDGSLAVVWELWRADQLEHVLHGVLKFEPR